MKDLVCVVADKQIARSCGLRNCSKVGFRPLRRQLVVANPTAGPWGERAPWNEAKTRRNLIRRSGAGRRDAGPDSFLRTQHDGEYTWAPERPHAD